MKASPEVKCDIASQDILDRILADDLPLDVRSTPLKREFHRDIYFDTVDRALEKRGVSCRVRIHADDRRSLSIRVRQAGGSGIVVDSDQVFEAAIPDVEPEEALRGKSEPARRLRGFIDPSRLNPRIELETERFVRRVRSGWLPLPTLEVNYDIVTVRDREGSEAFRELKIRRLRAGKPSLKEFAKALQDRYSLRSLLTTKIERAEKRLKELESEALASQVQGNREVTLIAIDDRRAAMEFDGNCLALPVQQGSGEAACRHLLRAHLATAEGQVRLMGMAAAAGTRPVLEVWMAQGLPRDVSHQPREHLQWVTIEDVMSRVGSPLIRDPRTVGALAVAQRSGMLPAPPTGEFQVPGRGAGVLQEDVQVGPDLKKPELPKSALDATQPVPDQFINVELSWLEFNARVLALAEDPGTPLLARLQFLSIFSSNLDEFFMVRIGGLKHAIAEGISDTSPDGLTPQGQLEAVSVRLAPLIERQQRCFHKVCLPDLERRGIRLLRWRDLDEDQQDEMRKYFDEQVFPVLTPQALTHAPGHPFPHMANLSLSLALMVKDPKGGPTHFAHIRVPSGLPRFVQLSSGQEFVTIEEVIGANLQPLYPGRLVEEVHPFRITRSGDIQVDEEGATNLMRAIEEEGATNLMRAIEEEVQRRPFGSVVRIEVDQGMPQVMRELLERELSIEEAGAISTLSSTDIFESEGLVDLGSLGELASLPVPELNYAKFVGRDPIDPGRPIFDVLREQDVLVYHPYDSFASTVQRLIVEGADDPDVTTIKLTLYRSGSQSAIVDALARAAKAGKDVSVFVELKARFDEERNIHWARKLEQAGIHVVTGLVRLKTHAKTALVVRREGDSVRRYVHIGTGNYNAATANFYTDLGLLSSRKELGTDLNDLFNELTGSSGPPQREFQQLLVAPTTMFKRFKSLIKREIEHAKAGRGGRIRVKLNGLADKKIIGTLYKASQAGVEIDLIIRGICSLRPGVPGLSERIRVFSILGRFLEHARIYHFGNGGDDEYFIGSADWRPRNLRRRVEVVAPVQDPEACQRLDEILEAELDDPAAWQMRPDGSYERQPTATGVDTRTAQERLIELYQAAG
jgi:polyphosphate kinase